MTSDDFSQDDLNHLASLLAFAGTNEIMPRFMTTSTLAIQEKSSAFDIVTEADQVCEALIAKHLRQRFPYAVVIGEEGVSSDAVCLDALASAPLAFLVDPLDGTRNFVAGVPLFGIMVAALQHGRIVAGVIHDPVTGRTAKARCGHGAYLTQRHGETCRLQVAATVSLARMEGIAGTNFVPEPLRSRMTANLSKLGITNWFRCAAHEYLLAATGHAHFLLYNRLMPWDHAAGWLIHHEAGGHGAHLDGEMYLPLRSSGGLLCATDRQTWTMIRDTLLA